MKISVVTVCYNAAATLPATLESVLHQRDVELDYQVVDGGSTDGTVDLLRRWEARFRAAGMAFTWTSEPDAGIYDAMNKGLFRATGDVLGILNADDRFEDETALADVVRAFSASEDGASLQLVYGDVRFVRGAVSAALLRRDAPRRRVNRRPTRPRAPQLRKRARQPGERLLLLPPDDAAEVPLQGLGLFSEKRRKQVKKKALITGVTGQDGSYLAEFLLEKGYEVHGVIRRSSTDYRERIAHLEGQPGFHLHYGDLGDSLSVFQVVASVRPDEIYNLAAQSHVQVSFDVPEFTANVDATGVLRILEAVRLAGLKETCRIYQASTSELYGKVEEVPQNERTPFHPYSPYAVAKLYGFWIVK